MDKELFRSNPRAFALDLVEQGLTSADNLLLAALNYMSHDDVRDMLDSNELSPRFDDEEEPELTYEQIKTAQENGAAWGHAEAQEWRDQNPDKPTAPDWTYGTYSGTFPDDIPEELHDTYETAMDNAAEDAWNDYFANEETADA